MRRFPKFYGLVTLGVRGQVVIPKDARSSLNIKAGDKLIVTSGPLDKKMIKIIPADDFARTLSHFEKHISTLKAKIAKKGK